MKDLGVVEHSLFRFNMAKRILTTEVFIEKAIKIHGNKYDYSKVKYVNSKTKVCIICPKHGEFWQFPNNHLSGHGCQKCVLEKSYKTNRMTSEEFIKKARKVYGDKYVYLNIEYINARTNVCIICPEHGEFWQTPDNHLHGHECPKCAHRSYKYTTEEWIKKAKEVHGDKYDYSKVNYTDNRTKVCIICKKHGEYWQSPHDHLRGNSCPKCKMSHLEEKVFLFLKNKQIEFEYDVRNLEWLNGLTLDFYLPKHKIAIECQGLQHFEDSGFFKCKEVKKRDEIKRKLCEENGIKMLYYSDLKINFPYNVITEISELISKINE